MEIIDSKGFNQNQRFIIASLMSIPVAIIFGLLTGFLNRFFPVDFLVISIGIAVSFTMKRHGRGVKLRFALMSVVITFLGIVLSEIVRNFGFDGLFILNNYRTLLQFIAYEDGFNIYWMIFRVLTLFLSFSYSRIA